MDSILYHYNIAFTLKTIYRSNIEKNKRITQGKRNSHKRLRVLNGLRKQYNLSREMQEYIKNYEIIYKRVIKEAKRRDNDKFVLRANNKTKAVWHVIIKEVGRSWKYEKKIELNNGTQLISNAQNVVGMLNTFL
jgi:hypothetical protein